MWSAKPEQNRVPMPLGGGQHCGRSPLKSRDRPFTSTASSPESLLLGLQAVWAGHAVYGNSSRISSFG
ncbi:hypothetical protein BGW38_006007, partial [Lunasporangiospora selenospora]